MQLCECCNQYDKCKLHKRHEGDARTVCSYFEKVEGLSQTQYDALKSLISERTTHPRQTPHQKKEYVNVDIPFELRTDSYPYPNAFIEFMNVDLAEEVARSAFKGKYIEPFFSMTDFMGNYDNKLIEAQTQFRIFWDDIPTGIDNLNKHLHAVIPQVVFDPDPGVLKCQAYFRGSAPGALTNVTRPIALFSVQFANILLRGQELKRCPICEDHFLPGKRGPKGDTCGKSNCRSTASKRKI
jgi:hypothetical protein